MPGVLIFATALNADRGLSIPATLHPFPGACKDRGDSGVVVGAPPDSEAEPPSSVASVDAAPVVVVAALDSPAPVLEVPALVSVVGAAPTLVSDAPTSAAPPGSPGAPPQARPPQASTRVHGRQTGAR